MPVRTVASAYTSGLPRLRGEPSRAGGMWLFRLSPSWLCSGNSVDVAVASDLATVVISCCCCSVCFIFWEHVPLPCLFGCVLCLISKREVSAVCGTGGAVRYSGCRVLDSSRFCARGAFVSRWKIYVEFCVGAFDFLLSRWASICGKIGEMALSIMCYSAPSLSDLLSANDVIEILYRAYYLIKKSVLFKFHVRISSKLLLKASRSFYLRRYVTDFPLPKFHAVLKRLCPREDKFSHLHFNKSLFFLHAPTMPTIVPQKNKISPRRRRPSNVETRNLTSLSKPKQRDHENESRRHITLWLLVHIHPIGPFDNSICILIYYYFQEWLVS